MSRILVAGDIAYRGRVGESINDCGHLILSDSIENALTIADDAIVNLESPIGDCSQFIKKSGPSLCSDEMILNAIKKAGFTGVTLANNHFFDCGQDGVRQTIEACEKFDLCYYGGGLDLSEVSKIKTLKGGMCNVDIINVCEHEFSVANDTHGGANGLDDIDVFHGIKESIKKGHKAIVVVHGGHEYYQLPSPRMQKTYRFFIDAGASAVVNHHQHCFCGYEVYKDCPIFYGLGNFYFDSPKRNGIWNQGYIVVMEIEDTVTYQIIPYVQFNSEPGVRDMTAEEMESFNSLLFKLNTIISDPMRLKEEWCLFASRKRIDRVFSPFYNRFTINLYRNKCFPRFVPLKQRLLQLNTIQCESHRDVLLYNMRDTMMTEK